ncbi:MAG: response regulator transcription factor [Chloroflexota bacterium]|nr:response regulator transcription factor [Chloroflexota bacterium]
MNPIRVLLADDHALVRAGILALLQKIPGLQVVGEADDGNQALEMVEENKPDIVLMDIAMPGLGGLEATARIAKDFPNVRVIILSMHANQEYVLEAMRAGAAGYLLKGARTFELEDAVAAVARGETYLSPGASKHLFGDVMHRATGQTTSFERLTPRQRQVLQLMADGYSRKQISQKLNVSAKTVDTYRAQLMEKLNIHDVASLVRYAIGIGLLKTDK